VCVLRRHVVAGRWSAASGMSCRCRPRSAAGGQATHRSKDCLARQTWSHTDVPARSWEPLLVTGDVVQCATGRAPALFYSWQGRRSGPSHPMLTEVTTHVGAHPLAGRPCLFGYSKSDTGKNTCRAPVTFAPLPRVPRPHIEPLLSLQPLERLPPRQ